MAHPEGAAEPNDLDLHRLVEALRLITDSADGAHLRKVDPTLHVGYEEAAHRLQIPESWLRKRINELPHRKMGKTVLFSHEDLRDISAMHAVRPDEGKSLPSGVDAHLAALTPSRRSRARSRI
ncbi:hypothetical protein GCM10017688_05490 [Streptomyces ramulosus]